jgi:hypothetical protein
MSDLIRTTMSVVLTPAAALASGTSPLFAEQSTVVTVVDEAGGPFLEIKNVEDAAKIRLDLEELEAVVVVARELVSQASLAEVKP